MTNLYTGPKIKLNPRYRGVRGLLKEVMVKQEEGGPEVRGNAMTVLQRRYLAKDMKGNVIEDPEQLYRRVARNIAEGDLEYGASPSQVEELAEQFYQLMARNQFMPNSPTLMKRRPRAATALGVLRAGTCRTPWKRFLRQPNIPPLSTKVVAVPDSPSPTFGRRTTGWGSTGGIASGPVSFIRIFDTATDVVKQGGTRRGANMAVLDVRHPDVLKFVHAKDDDSSLQNFNISVAVTEEFMQAAKRGENYDLVNPRTEKRTGKPERG